MAKRGVNKEEIRQKISKNYYKLDFTIDEIRDTFELNETCQETVPLAIEAF
jgi:type I restriction enzyme M protein